MEEVTNLVYSNRPAHVHLLVSPAIHPKQFRLAVNRLHCNELHLFGELSTSFDEWREECNHMGIYYHEHRLASDQIDMLEDIYHVGEIVANRNIFLCLNSLQPLLCNLITQFISLELRHNHEKGERDFYTNIGCYYHISGSKVLVSPIYPHWDQHCLSVIEILTGSSEGMAKEQLLKQIQDVLSEDFSIHKLNRALEKIERWLTGFQGFRKEKRGSRAFVYELKLLIEM
ncbi:MAG: hypothetical protein ACFFD4_36820 [Candidatus Odinarchaeota archaeon]